MYFYCIELWPNPRTFSDLADTFNRCMFLWFTEVIFTFTLTSHLPEYLKLVDYGNNGGFFLNFFSSNYQSFGLTPLTPSFLPLTEQLVFALGSALTPLVSSSTELPSLISLADLFETTHAPLLEGADFSFSATSFDENNFYTAPAMPFLSWGALKEGSIFSLASGFSFAPRSHAMGFTPEYPDFHWASELADLLRFDLVGSFSGSFNATQALNLVSPQVPTLASFFLKLDALQD